MVQDESSGYDVVWNGGPGLTTVGAQRPGAVIQDVKEGDVVQWIALQQYDAAHPHRVPGRDSDSFAYVVLDDRAYVPQPAYRWAVARLTAQWSRVLRYARYGGWPVCQLCGRAFPQYRRGFAHWRESRVHSTTRHAAVCQECYVRWRMARGKWAGIRSFAAWRATQPVLTAAERLNHRRAMARASWARRWARMTPDQQAQHRARALARYHRQKKAARAARAAQAPPPAPDAARPDSR